MSGKLLCIFVAEKPFAEPVALAEAALVAGKGIVGDRCYREEGARPDKELTLVEAEQVDRFNARTGLGIPYRALRRNLLTSGISLTELVGKRFRVGCVEAEGMELCEPCATIAKLLSTSEMPPRRFMTELVHRAGLRARIVKSGVIRPGDDIAIA